MVLMKKTYYFDYAAATPVSSQVLTAMEPFWQTQFYNPSALYLSAREVRKHIDSARASVAKTIGVKPYEIIFTAGATESINLAIAGISKMYPMSGIIISSMEHEAVSEAAKLYFNKNLKICPVHKNGIIQPEKLKDLIDDNTVLISFMYVNNEIGTVQPLKQVSKMIEQVKQNRQKSKNPLPLYLHSDASQAPNYLSVKEQRLGVDLLSLNGGKIYGPKQSGCLFVQKYIEIKPLIAGGGQERGLRGGTENVANIIGFAKALELAQANYKIEARRVAKLRNYLLEELQKSVSGLTVNGSLKQRIANNLNISIAGVSGETLVHYLDTTEIMVATGAACSAAKDKPSATLKSLGLSAKQIEGSIRISLGTYTNQEQIKHLLKELPKTLAKVKQLA